MNGREPNMIIRLDFYEAQKFGDTIKQFMYESASAASCNQSHYYADTENKFASYLQYLKDGKAIAYGAIEDGNLVGIAWAYEYPFRHDKKRIYVSLLHVKQEYRRRRIGSDLLKAVETEALQQNYHAIFLHTEGTNSDAIRFYGREGYSLERVQMVKNRPSECDAPERSGEGVCKQ